MPAVIPLAHTAAIIAQDGFYADRSGASDVQLLVVGHRVVAARASLDQRPATSSVPTTCARAPFSFVGPIGEAGNVSTRARFRLTDASTPWFTISGRVVSATRITGTLTKSAGGHGDLCSGTARFSVSRA